jgi:hypothetical protein
MSSVPNEGRALSSISRTGGQGSLDSSKAVRFFLMAKSVRMRRENAMVVKSAMADEYAVKP